MRFVNYFYRRFVRENGSINQNKKNQTTTRALGTTISMSRVHHLAGAVVAPLLVAGCGMPVDCCAVEVAAWRRAGGGGWVAVRRGGHWRRSRPGVRCGGWGWAAVGAAVG